VSVGSPNAGHMQWKAELSGDAVLDAVRLAYIPQNRPPVVKSINVFSEAAESVIDSQRESFRLRLQDVPAAAHVLVLRHRRCRQCQTGEGRHLMSSLRDMEMRVGPPLADGHGSVDDVRKSNPRELL
jgi:hypothetical protein